MTAAEQALFVPKAHPSITYTCHAPLAKLAPSHVSFSVHQMVGDTFAEMLAAALVLWRYANVQKRKPITNVAPVRRDAWRRAPKEPGIGATRLRDQV